MNNQDYDVIVVGAGIGGLAVGNVLVKNGMKVLILEKNHAPGGGVSTYYRKGYPIDISHSICAINEGACLRNMLEYIGVYQKLEFLKLDKTFIFLTDNYNESIFCYADLDRYAHELEHYFPNEISNIKKFFNIIKEIWNEVLRSYYNPPFTLFLLYPFLFPRLFRYKNYTFEQLLSKFRMSSRLKEVISAGWPYLGMEKEYVSAIYMVSMLSAYQQDGTYFIKGGLGRLVNALTANFRNLGGEILLDTEVKKILVNSKKSAYAVMDRQNKVYKAHRIVSNADSKRTFLELLDKNYLPEKFLDKITKMTVTRSAIQIHIIAEAEISNEFMSSGAIIMPCQINLEEKIQAKLKSSVQTHNKSALFLSIRTLDDFIDGSPKNNFIFNVLWYPANYHLWKDFLNNFKEDEYNKVKEELTGIIIGELKKYWEIRRIHFTEVMTPLSFERWLGATEGAIYDLAMIPSQSLLDRLKHITPIRNLYLVGTKTFPGNGIAGGLSSAFILGDIILNKKLTKGKIAL
ncbi:MAG: NAD(P)/FAD-dependent oxidoreductase [Candidatus Omnitrophota bacterium]|jgi:prolycopene isomerase